MILNPQFTVDRYRHTEPCGPHRDPGPRDDSGRRWHWCYRITVDGYVVKTGRRSDGEIAEYLKGHVMKWYVWRSPYGQWNAGRGDDPCYLYTSFPTWTEAYEYAFSCSTNDRMGDVHLPGPWMDGGKTPCGILFAKRGRDGVRTVVGSALDWRLVTCRTCLDKRSEMGPPRVWSS